jgi:hypothetical protein
MAIYDMSYLDPTSESRKCLNVEPTVLKVPRGVRLVPVLLLVEITAINTVPLLFDLSFSTVDDVHTVQCVRVRFPVGCEF